MDLLCFFLSCVCYAFVGVCLYVLCGHLPWKGWPLGSRLRCLTVSLSLSHWYPGSGVELDCIDSWSLYPYLFWPHPQDGRVSWGKTFAAMLLHSWFTLIWFATWPCFEKVDFWPFESNPRVRGGLHVKYLRPCCCIRDSLYTLRNSLQLQARIWASFSLIE